jgi:hypothetical protein
MLTWKENEWYKKDGFTDDPMEYCQTAWDDVVADKVQDWHPQGHDGFYDEEAETLESTFFREFVGSDEGDYTYNINTDYEFVTVIGTWRSMQTGLDNINTFAT